MEALRGLDVTTSAESGNFNNSNSVTKESNEQAVMQPLFPQTKSGACDSHQLGGDGGKKSMTRKERKAKLKAKAKCKKILGAPRALLPCCCCQRFLTLDLLGSDLHFLRFQCPLS